MYHNVKILPYLEVETKNKQEGINLVDSLKSFLNSVNGSRLEKVVVFSAEKRRRVVDKENQVYQPNKWIFRIYVFNESSVKEYEQYNRHFHIKFKGVSIF